MKKYSLVDSHCHLDFQHYSHDLDQVIMNARLADINGILTISTCISNVQKVLEVAEAYKDVWCTTGIHPQEVEHEQSVTVAQLTKLTSHPKIIGLGETGLDYFHTCHSIFHQQHSFRTHIAAARETNLPLIIHSRKADNDMATILMEEQRTGQFHGIMHCFNSGLPLASLAVELGLLISISGIITFHNVASLEAIIRYLPLNHLLIETDAPFLSPTPRRGVRNEPAFITYTVEKIAELKKISLRELADITTCNFLNMFRRVNLLE